MFPFVLDLIFGEGRVLLFCDCGEVGDLSERFFALLPGHSCCRLSSVHSFFFLHYYYQLKKVTAFTILLNLESFS